MSRDCCVALPRAAMGLSAVCDCGISCSYLLFENFFSVFLRVAVLHRFYCTCIRLVTVPVEYKQMR